MAMFDDEAPPQGYRWEYSGSGNTAVRYPVLDMPAAELSRDLVGTSVAPSMPTIAPELQPEPSTAITPHRYAPGEIPGGPPQEPTLDQMKYELARSNLTPIDWLAGAGENALSLLTSPLGMLGGYAGLGYHMLRGAPFDEANTRAADWARATSYQPTTLAGQEIAEDYVNPVLSRLPPVVSGINARALQVPKGTTGALGAGVKRDINQFSNDVYNARNDITPGYPTLGSEFQKAFVEPRLTIYDMLAGLEPSEIPSTASAAVKTKGGNFPLSFDNDLEVSGQIGRHLNRQLNLAKLTDLKLTDQFDNLAAIQYGTFLKNKGISVTQPLTKSESIPLINEFISTHREQFPQLKTLDELKAIEQAKKDFITGQYSRYLTNEMGTGAKTDTLVRLAEQGIAVPEIAQVFDANYPGRAADLEGPWVLPAVRNLLTANKLKGIEAVQQTATTPYGKYIESLADEGVTPTSKKLYEDFLTLQKKLGLPTKYADKPTPFERIPEDTPIWDLPELWSNTELGLDRVVQKAFGDLESGAIKPENIKNVSIESLVRGLMDENLKKLAAEAKELSTFPTVFQRPGSKNVWKNIVDEASSEKTVAMHKRVGDKMGICIGDYSYCDRAWNKKGFHDVLFGPNGEPHVAIESRPATLLRAYNVLPRKDRDLLHDETAKELGYTLNDAMGDKSPARERAFEEARANAYLKHFGTPPPEIHQVKGKGNATTLDPKYVEDTRDFLNSREWLPSSASSSDFNKKNVTIGGLVDTQYDDSLDAYAKRAKFSSFDEVLNRFEAAKLLGRQFPGRFATDKDITEFIKGPETLRYDHGSPISGMTTLRTDIDRTRAAGTGLWLAQPYDTAGTYAGRQGSVYGVEVKNKDLDVFDAKNSAGGNISLDTILYHADGTTSTGTEIARALGVTKLATDDLARYSKAKGAKGLHILNVSDWGTKLNSFHKTNPDYANNLVIFDPSLVKVIKEDRVPEAKAEGGAVRMADGGAVTDTLDKMVKSPQASNLLNLDLPNLIAAKQQARPMKRGGKVDFSNNIDDMRYALSRRQG